MTTERQCPSCGSDRLEPGTIQGAGRVYFKPENAKFLSLQTSDVTMTANICLECGVIVLVGDLGKAKKLVDET